MIRSSPLTHPNAFLQQHDRCGLGDLVLEGLRVGEQEYGTVVGDVVGRANYGGEDVVSVRGAALVVVCIGTGRDAVQAGDECAAVVELVRGVNA